MIYFVDHSSETTSEKIDGATKANTMVTLEQEVKLIWFLKSFYNYASCGRLRNASLWNETLLFVVLAPIESFS